MLPTRSAPGPREIRIYFIDDDAPRLVEQFKDWWRQNRRPGVVVTTKLLSEPPWLDEATQKGIEEFEPDLIVLDLVLRGGASSGERVLRVLKTSQHLRAIPVFVYSSHFPSDSEERTNAEKKYKRTGVEGLYDKVNDEGAFDCFVEFALERQQKG